MTFPDTMGNGDHCSTCFSWLASSVPSPASTDQPINFGDESKRKPTSQPKAQSPPQPPSQPPHPNTQRPRDPEKQDTTRATQPRRTPCCSRFICAECQNWKPRFRSYCPFCQISEEPSVLPQGLRDPPAYDEEDGAVAVGGRGRGGGDKARQDTLRSGEGPGGEAIEDGPPAYTPNTATKDRGDVPSYNEAGTTPPDVLHHLHPTDTLASLSLSYHVPAPILRSHNNLFSDSLLAARRTLLIPGIHYQGPSLSGEPVESEEERIWKGRLRRFMVRSKCARYDVAEVYLKGAMGEKGSSRNGGGIQMQVSSEDREGDANERDEVVEEAVMRWEDDERWEREHPYEKEKGKAVNTGRRKKGFGGSLASQLP